MVYYYYVLNADTDSRFKPTLTTAGEVGGKTIFAQNT